MENKKDECQLRIDKLEIQDRIIGKMVMEELFNDINSKNIYIAPCPIECTYDISGHTDEDYIVEVKENTCKSQYTPRAIIKKKKVKELFKEANGRDIYFMSLKDKHSAYIFYLNSLDWNRVELKMMRQKKRQLDPNSEYYTVPTYFINYSDAVWSCDCSKYYEDYALLSQTEKENYLPQT